MMNRQDVYDKFRKKVKIGDTIYPSVTAAARSIGKDPSHMTRYLKLGKMRDGTPVSYVK